MSSFFLCANWKMHKDPKAAKDYLQSFLKFPPEALEHFIFFVPALVASTCRLVLKGSAISWGAQNCYFENQGAFTGENSPQVLSQMGASYCLVGHSERRHLFAETDDLIARKVQSLWNEGIHPVLCIGETKVEKENQLSTVVIQKQLQAILKWVDSPEFHASSTIYIAYEPVWAIGTGIAADPKYIQWVCEEIRNILKPTKKRLVLLYGGSVNVKNIATIFEASGVDGFLVGKASLDPYLFFDLFKALYPCN